MVISSLGRESALSLLLAAADIDDSLAAEGTVLRRRALEIVDLTGGLPLAVGLAAGFIEANGGEITQDLVTVMREERQWRSGAGAGETGEEGGAGLVHLQHRIIQCSLGTLGGRLKTLTLACFELFACFPDDVPVPASVFDALAPLLTELAATKDRQDRAERAAKAQSELDASGPASLNGHSGENAGADIGPRGNPKFREVIIKILAQRGLTLSPQKPSFAGVVTSAVRVSRLAKERGPASSLMTAHEATVAVRGCLTELLRLNLLFGSLSDESGGLQCHGVRVTCTLRCLFSVHSSFASLSLFILPTFTFCH